jgi:hypothetical protein
MPSACKAPKPSTCLRETLLTRAMVLYDNVLQEGRKGWKQRAEEVINLNAS